MRKVSVLGVFAIVLCTCCLGQAQDKSTDAATHFKKGVALFNENKKDEAVQEFNAAYEIKPSWKILYNIGQCHASLKRYGMAIESFEKYLGEGGDEVPKERQDEVLGELDRLRRMVGSIKVHGPDGVEIYIDKILRGKTRTWTNTSGSSTMRPVTARASSPAFSPRREWRPGFGSSKTERSCSRCRKPSAAARFWS